MEIIQPLGSSGHAGAALEVLTAATDEAEVDSQSAQVVESVLTGSTYLVVVRVDAKVTVVVSSTEVQSPHVVVPVEAGSTGALVAQSAHLS